VETTTSVPKVSIAKGGVRFSAEELAEVDSRGHPVLRIPRSRIRQVELRWGRQAARPLVQLVLGVAFAGTGGGIEIAMILEWLRHGGTIIDLVVVGLAMMALLGVWLLWTALRRGFYLDVQTDSRAEKICFDRRLSREEVEAFLDEARQRLGYQILVN
jgi:nitrogen fixation-related uncharacterized protein